MAMTSATWRAGEEFDRAATQSSNLRRRRLPQRFIERGVCAFAHAIDEFNPEGVIGAPYNATGSGATVAVRDAQLKFIRNCARSYAA
jgi:hypothetical protein